MISDNIVSTHIFLYYDQIAQEVLDQLKTFYDGTIYLSLVENNPNNKRILSHAKSKFDTKTIFVKNKGTDQYGFYHSFKQDNSNTKWILYLHDKHPDKKEWLFDLINDLSKVTNKYLKQDNVGIFSSHKHKNQVKSMNEILTLYGNMSFCDRKNLVQSMHTILWLKELQRILLEKQDLVDENYLYPTFSAGNIFLATREVIKVSHDCVYETFFNDCYRTDGEMAHGLERFYFYVSKCLKLNNIFI